MDSTDVKVLKENRGPLENIVQTENSSEPMILNGCKKSFI